MDMADIEQTKSPMEMVNATSQLWIGAKVIGFSGDRNRMDLQIVLTDAANLFHNHDHRNYFF